jgi:hypothetical protein
MDLPDLNMRVNKDVKKALRQSPSPQQPYFN